MSAYPLIRLIFDLEREENRAAYLADAAAYVDRYDVDARQRSLVLERDWQGLVDAGVSIYVLTRLGGLHDLTLLDLGAAMRGTDRDGLTAFLSRQNADNERFAVVPEGSHG